MTSSNRKPVQQYRDGAIRAAIWENSSEKGTFYSVTITRTFKEGEKYKDSTSFSGAELLRVSRIAALAYDYILAKRAEAGVESDAEEAPQ